MANHLVLVDVVIDVIADDARSLIYYPDTTVKQINLLIGDDYEEIKSDTEANVIKRFAKVVCDITENGNFNYKFLGDALASTYWPLLVNKCLYHNYYLPTNYRLQLSDGFRKIKDVIDLQEIYSQKTYGGYQVGLPILLQSWGFIPQEDTTREKLKFLYDFVSNYMAT